MEVKKKLRQLGRNFLVLFPYMIYTLVYFPKAL